MKLENASKLGVELFKEHGLHDWNHPEKFWNIQFDRCKRRAGACYYDRRVIMLSRYFVEMNSDFEVKDTILHEIAHALAPRESGHDLIWKSIAIRIGARPERCADKHVVMPLGVVSATCNCGIQHTRYRLPRPGVSHRCAFCKVSLHWERTR